ncbi:MAG TPA: putative glycoside hydrolase [Gemmatirosa sp.]
MHARVRRLPARRPLAARCLIAGLATVGLATVARRASAQPRFPAAVHGVYIPAAVAGSRPTLDSLLDRLRGTRVDAVVLDVKENGIVPYRSRVPLARAAGAVHPVIADVRALLRAVRARGLYPIARIVCFRDPVLAAARPGWAILGADGQPWLDPTYRQRWVDPYDRRVWAYNVALAREALALGFGEVQWDYVRFPDVPDSTRATLAFPAARGRAPAAAIDAFVASSRRALGAPVTVDVFGRAITESGDSEGIGQNWDSLATVADAILPMVYPSHYVPGNFDLPAPTAAPYELVRRAMAAAVARTRQLPRARARIRPWLQAFTRGEPPYGGDEVRAQVRGAADAGVDEWVLWNATGDYPDAVLAGVARERQATPPARAGR